MSGDFGIQLTRIAASDWTGWGEEQRAKYQIFDVRSPREWEGGILPGVTKIALYDNQGLLNEHFLEAFKLRHEEGRVPAFLCQAGMRSLAAAKMISEATGLRVVNLEGGMCALQK